MTPDDLTTEQRFAVDNYVIARGAAKKLRRRLLEEAIPDAEVREAAIERTRQSRERLARAYKSQGVAQPKGGWAPWLGKEWRS